MADPRLAFVSRLDKLEALCSSLADRVAVLEDHTINHENRLQDIEEWQEQTDEKLDQEE